MLIDSHCHLHDKEFFTEDQAEKCLKQAKERKVEKIVCIGTSYEDSLDACQFASKHKDVYWTYGMHPEHASNRQNIDDCAEDFRTILQTPDISQPIAIGEVGLDYHYDGYDRQAQIRLFEQMLQIATDYNLPLSFHIREAFNDFFPVIENFPDVRGVVHSFSDNKKVLRRILENTEFYIGVNGMATYCTLPTPPLSRILLETDAPFLTPVPYRGIINEPRYVYDIAEWLSNKLELDFATVEKETTKNAEGLFRLSDTRCCS